MSEAWSLVCRWHSLCIERVSKRTSQSLIFSARRLQWPAGTWPERDWNTEFGSRLSRTWGRCSEGGTRVWLSPGSVRSLSCDAGPPLGPGERGLRRGPWPSGTAGAGCTWLSEKPRSMSPRARGVLGSVRTWAADCGSRCHTSSELDRVLRGPRKDAATTANPCGFVVP